MKYPFYMMSVDGKVKLNNALNKEVSMADKFPVNTSKHQTIELQVEDTARLIRIEKKLDEINELMALDSDITRLEAAIMRQHIMVARSDVMLKALIEDRGLKSQVALADMLDPD